MSENKENQNRDDFSSKNFIERNQHNRDISSLRKRLDTLESRVLEDKSFAETFLNAQKHEKQIDEAVIGIIDQYDNHKLKINGVALLKWLGVLIIGGIIGALLKTMFE